MSRKKFKKIFLFNFDISLVFSMAAQSDKPVDWKLIQGELEKVLATKIYYTRFSKDEKAGHFVVGKFDIEEAKKEAVNNKIFFL